MKFICPKCSAAMKLDGRRVVCSSGHSYDMAKEGYINLLLSAKGGTHGDNKEMVIARRSFLSRGYYEPLAARLAELALEYTPACGSLLDAGLGEGYYTDKIEKALFERDKESFVWGFDISKDAVRVASKKNPHISLAVSGSYHMPIADGSFNTVINTFSPLAKEETHRVLCEGGTFIMAIPDEDHLFGLKSAIYKTPYKNTVSDSTLDGFELLHTERLRYEMNLSDGESIRDLFMMTPYAYRTSPEDREKILSLTQLKTDADFRIFVYRKK